MTREPSALSLVAEGASRIADAVGVVLLCWLSWRMFFVFDSALQGRALLVGLIGVLACWTDGRAKRNVPLAMLAYVAIGLLSAAVHRWSTVASAPETTWLSLFTPASHLAVMAVFIYGAAHLLRTPQRLSWFVVFMVAAVSVLATQIAFDRASTGFIYDRGGLSLPSVPHWSGIHGTSLLLAITMPFALSMPLTSHHAGRMLSGLVLVGALFLVAFLNGSRGGQLAMAVSALSIGIAGVFRIQSRWGRTAVGIGLLLALAGVGGSLLYQRTSLIGINFLSNRDVAWQQAAEVSLENPWTGVGPGNYGQAVTAKFGASAFTNAHNVVLHTAAETGVLGALSLTGLLLWLLRGSWRSWSSNRLPMIALGVVGALIGFLVHSASENFLDARSDVERTRLVIWGLFAAALSMERWSAGAAPGDEP